jgi:RNA polymerase sigma-70 factor, ECF subfamily
VTAIHPPAEIQNEDIALLERIGNQDMLAMETFYRQYENCVYRFALKKLGNEFESAEIVNTVMLEVWNTAAAFEGRSKVSTWLIGITHHRIIDLMRKRKKNHTPIDEVEAIIEDADAPDMARVITSSQSRRLIDACLERLSGDHKQVLELLFFLEQSYEEIASCMACSIGTVKSRLFHAKKGLKLCLEKNADPEQLY